jgi:Ca-activated chloride channel family protein
MRKMLVFSLTLLLFCHGSIFALGALYARRALSNDPGTPLWLKSYDATVTITDQIAVTHVDHIFKNETANRMEGIFVFPLPKGAIVTELALWINGVRVVGDVMERDTARAVYESVVRKAIDPALLEYMGDNIFKLSVFPIEPNGNAMSERRIEITYAELLPFNDGHVTYSFFMKTANLSSKPVERASINGIITSQKTITSMSSPSHPGGGTLLSIRSQDQKNYTFVYGNEKAHSEVDLLINYQLEADGLALKNCIYLPDMKKPMFFDSTGDDGYFLLWVTPPKTDTMEKVLPKNVALVADVSSSMSGTRIIQLRKSLNTMIDMLSEKDRFSIIAFSSGVQTFKSDMVQATSVNKTEAHTFVNALSEAGLTNYEDALRKALNSTWSDSGINVTVFFTDGKPTWPIETSPAKILTLVKDLNTRSVSLFTFGVGSDLDETFLRSLASQNSGEYYQITSDGAIASILSGFMTRISYPLLKKITMDYSTLDQYDVYPRTLPDLFAGTQLSVLGRFRKEGVSKITFTGQRAAEQVVIKQDVQFTKDQLDHPFVPRMWASAKIDYLMNEIAVAGEQKELVDNVKKLGKKYSIITKYTSLLVLEPNKPTAVEDKLAMRPVSFKFTAVMDMSAHLVTLNYALPYGNTPHNVKIRIFDARGTLVRELVNEVVAGGNYFVKWNCRNEHNMTVATGSYIAVITAGSFRQMLQIQVVR